MTDPANFRLSGAVDLGGLKQPPPAPASANASPHVIDVTEASFQADVVETSRQVPVVIDFWAAWCGPCRQLSPILEKLAAEGDGKWVLAKIDVDANQRLAGAAGVQGIPAVKAVVDGQIVGEFTGALPEAQVRQWIDQLLSAAAQRPEGDAPAEPGVAATPGEQALDAAYDALARGDLDAAEASLREVLVQMPDDLNAKSGLAQIAIVRRAQTYDESALTQSLAANSNDLAANIGMSDIELLNGQPDAAFDRLINLFKQLDGDDRERVRTHLLGLFDAVDPADPAALKARRDLASALF